MLKSYYRTLLTIFLLAFFSAGTVTAAEVISGSDSWLLEADQTLNDDLYVSGGEIIIEGTVNGDVMVVGDFLRVQGEVNGDVIFIGGGLLLDGVVNGDVRVAAPSISIQGTVKEDLTFASWLGVPGYEAQFQLGPNRNLVFGTHITEGVIEGDAYGFSGFFALESSQINGDVLGDLSGFEIKNSEIRGNVDISVLQIEADEESKVLGPEGFQYRSVAPSEVSTLTETIDFEAIEPDPIDWLLILRTIVGRIAGLSILGWFILRFRPNWLVEPVAAINSRPGWASWLGLTVSTTLFLGSFAFAILISFFWGGLAALTFAGFIIMGLGTLWFLSPLIAGFWLGQRLSALPFQGLLFGCGMIVVLQSLPMPLFSFSVSWLAFILALGGLVLAPRIEELPSQV